MWLVLLHCTSVNYWTTKSWMLTACEFGRFLGYYNRSPISLIILDGDRQVCTHNTWISLPEVFPGSYWISLCPESQSRVDHWFSIEKKYTPLIYYLLQTYSDTDTPRWIAPTKLLLVPPSSQRSGLVFQLHVLDNGRVYAPSRPLPHHMVTPEQVRLNRQIVNHHSTSLPPEYSPEHRYSIGAGADSPALISSFWTNGDQTSKGN